MVAAEPGGGDCRERDRAGRADQDEHRPDRQGMRCGCGHDEPGECQRPRRGERRVRATGGPQPVGRIDRACAERDLDGIAELRRGEGVDHRADPQARRGLPRAQSGAGRSERRPPRAHRAGERGEERDEREGEPGRLASASTFRADAR
jgi:hypothetical protein